MPVTRLTGSRLLIVGMPMVLPSAMSATSAIHFARMHIAFKYASRLPCQANPACRMVGVQHLLGTWREELSLGWGGGQVRVTSIQAHPPPHRLELDVTKKHDVHQTVSCLLHSTLASMPVTRLTGSYPLIVGMPMVLPSAMGATSAIHFARMHIAFRYASRLPCEANPTRHSASKERPGWPDYPGLLSRRHCFPMAVSDTSARCLGEVHNQEPFPPWWVCSFATSANHTVTSSLPP